MNPILTGLCVQAGTEILGNLLPVQPKGAGGAREAGASFSDALRQAEKTKGPAVADAATRVEAEAHLHILKTSLLSDPLVAPLMQSLDEPLTLQMTAHGQLEVSSAEGRRVLLPAGSQAAETADEILGLQGLPNPAHARVSLALS